MHIKRAIFPLIAVLVLILSALACGGSNEGTLVSSNDGEISDSEDGETTNDTDQEPSQSFEIFNVGDLIEVKDQTIRLNSIEYQGSVLEANFTIVNNGSDDLVVSSLLSFSAKKEDGTQLDQEIFDCGSSGLDGSVLPGDKLRGDICWSDASPDDNIKIYYESNIFSQGAVVWYAEEGTAEELETDSPATLETFEIGDKVQVKDHYIRINEIQYQGTVLVVEFFIENLGDDDIGASSMLSFSTKRKDGTLLDQEIFDCPSPGFDGQVIPGDRLRGYICWSDAALEDEIKIYYESDFFAEGAVVWNAVPGVANPLDLDDRQLEVDVYAIGDVIETQNHTIVLNSINFSGNVLQANFTIENTGTEDVDVSSMLSFYTRKGDGTNLDQELFNCGSSLDGTILPGDKLRGDICWSGASQQDDIKIYYQANIFGEGAVVWNVE